MCHRLRNAQQKFCLMFGVCLLAWILAVAQAAPPCDLKAIFHTPPKRNYDDFEILERSNFDSSPPSSPSPSGSEDATVKFTQPSPRSYANAQILLRFPESQVQAPPRCSCGNSCNCRYMAGGGYPAPIILCPLHLHYAPHPNVVAVSSSPKTTFESNGIPKNFAPQVVPQVDSAPTEPVEIFDQSQVKAEIVNKLNHLPSADTHIKMVPLNFVPSEPNSIPRFIAPALDASYGEPTEAIDQSQAEAEIAPKHHHLPSVGTHIQKVPLNVTPPQANLPERNTFEKHITQSLVPYLSKLLVSYPIFQRHLQNYQPISLPNYQPISLPNYRPEVIQNTRTTEEFSGYGTSSGSAVYEDPSKIVLYKEPTILTLVPPFRQSQDITTFVPAPVQTPAHPEGCRCSSCAKYAKELNE